MNDEKVYRLTKPMKSGLLHLVFSRFLVIILLLIFQVLLMAAFYLWLNQQLAAYAAALQGLFTLVMIIYLFNSQMDSSGKLTWMFIIAIAPVAGALLLAFIQGNFGHRKLKEMVSHSIDATKTMLPQPEGVLENLEQGESGTEDLVTYLNRSGCFPAYQDSAATYYPIGEQAFQAMLEDLQKAEKFIFLEYFIIEEGYMWGKILEILTEKAKMGVEVRVMYDGMCEMFQLKPGYWKLLKEQGIQAKAFAEIKPLVSSHYNYRDHRKILIVDGKLAYTGGINLADEYINRVKRFGHWKDNAIRIQGTAVRSFTLMFLQMWETNSAGGDLTPYLEAETENPEHPSGTIIPYNDCPLDGEHVGETVYMDILYRATDYVHIMTPYLILDGELSAALKYAAERGVDVKMILPGIPDKKMAYALAKSHYRSLLASGVKIYEYTPGFIHSKVFVSDDQKAVVGTINLDYRSLYHHFECAAYLYQADCVPDVEKDFEDTLAKCREVTAETVKKEKLFYRIMGGILKFVAPLM